MSLLRRTLGAFPGLRRLKMAGLAVVLALAGCTRSEPRADLVMINGPDPETLDLALVTSLEGLRVVAGVFEGLARNDPVTAPRSRPGPELGDFPGRTRLYFSPERQSVLGDREPITAEDVVYSWAARLIRNNRLGIRRPAVLRQKRRGLQQRQIKDPSQVGVRALDARTVQVELNQPTAFFLDLCAFQTLSVVPRQVIGKYGEDWMRARPLPSSGPYVLEFWRLNDKIRLRKNPFYWDAANTKSGIADYLCLSAPNTALNCLRNRPGRHYLGPRFPAQ